MLDALDGAIDQILVLGNRLLLEPYVKLALNILHLKVCITLDALIVLEHAPALQECRDALAPAQLEAHAE